MEFNNDILIEIKKNQPEMDIRNDLMNVLLFLNAFSIIVLWLIPKKVVTNGVPTREYNDLVDDHNDLLDEKAKIEDKNRGDVQDYNALVDKHNALLEELVELQEKSEKDVDDYNELVDKHNVLLEENAELLEKLEQTEKRLARLESRISRWF